MLDENDTPRNKYYCPCSVISNDILTILVAQEAAKLPKVKVGGL